MWIWGVQRNAESEVTPKKANAGNVQSPTVIEEIMTIDR